MLSITPVFVADDEYDVDFLPLFFSHTHANCTQQHA